ncbi:MAG: acetyltransferase [Flavobacteriaceae bacterium]|nr:acetyltransferase [Flavobacteriaceae bacterium]
MAKVIIFGLRDLAELAHYYLNVDSEHEVVAFSVNYDYLPKERLFKSLPIIPFEEVVDKYPTTDYKFLAPMASLKMNTLREQVYYAIKEKGYDMISYISSKANVYENVSIGENCFIQAGTTLQPFTKVGNNVVMWSNNSLGHHGEIKDHVTLAAQVAIAGRCSIGENSFLGTNSTIRNGTVLAKGTLVGIGSVITNNTEEWSVYMGNPARRIGKNISKSILHI